MDIICRPHNQVDFIDNFNNALRKLPFQSNEIYLLGDFNIKKYFKKLKEAQLKHRLLKPYVEVFLAFGLYQLRARSLVVSDLLSVTKGSRFESGC